MQQLEKALAADGIPHASLAVDDVHAGYDRLSALEVWFAHEPAMAGTITIAIFDDTCGDLVRLTAAG